MRWAVDEECVRLLLGTGRGGRTGDRERLPARGYLISHQSKIGQFAVSVREPIGSNAKRLSRGRYRPRSSAGPPSWSFTATAPADRAIFRAALAQRAAESRCQSGSSPLVAETGSKEGPKGGPGLLPGWVPALGSGIKANMHLFEGYGPGDRVTIPQDDDEPQEGFSQQAGGLERRQCFQTHALFKFDGGSYC